MPANAKIGRKIRQSYNQKQIHSFLTNTEKYFHDMD